MRESQKFHPSDHFGSRDLPPLDGLLTAWTELGDEMDDGTETYSNGLVFSGTLSDEEVRQELERFGMPIDGYKDDHFEGKPAKFRRIDDIVLVTQFWVFRSPF